MAPLILYTPMGIALAVLFYSARGALRGYGNGRLVPLTLLIAAALFGSREDAGRVRPAYTADGDELPAGTAE